MPKNMRAPLGVHRTARAVDANNQLLYRARALQAVPPHEGVTPKERRKGWSGFRGKLFLAVQLVAIASLLTVAIQRLRRSESPSLDGIDEDARFSSTHGLPTPACRSTALKKTRYMEAFANALDNFAEYAPASVRNASVDFQDWQGYIAADKKRQREFENFAKVTFGSFSPGYTVVDRSPPARKDLVTYLRVWKSGNDAIRMNLVGAAGNGSDISSKIASRPRRMRGRLNQESIPRLIRRSKIFTFVRDPIDHFVAGYNELEWRWFHELKNYTSVVSEHCRERGCVFHEFEEGSPERVWAFVGDLLLGKLIGLHELGHVFPQSGVLSSGYLPEFIGKLERFGDDWNHVMDTYLPDKSKGYVFDHELGQHDSTGFAAGIAAKELIKNHDFGLIKTLQELLIFDYLCFGYELPIKEDGEDVMDDTDMDE